MAGDSVERSWLLGIDTSALTASVALAPVGEDPGTTGAELLWTAGRDQTATLLGQIDALLRLCGIETSSLSGVAVTTGPGSFNALRVGLSTAKALCYAEDVPLFGAGTLDTMAFAFHTWRLPVRAFVDAGRRRVVVGDYRPDETGLRLRGELEHRTREELADGLIEPTILAGDLPAEIARELVANEQVILPPASVRRRRASILLDMVYPRWLAGDADELAALEPVYIHSRPRRRTVGKQAP